MALAANALVTLEEFKKELHLDTAIGTQDSRLERVIDRASSIISNFCRAQLVYLGTPYVEYHTIKEPRFMFHLLEAPVVSVTELKEDAGRNYAGATALVADTDYIVHKTTGKVTRVSGSTPVEWLTGVRVVRVTYVAGYERLSGGAGTCPAIPDALKHVCFRLGALIWREIDRKKQGILTESSSAGTMTRFGSAHLTNDMEEELEPYVRDFGIPTGERD